MKTETAAKSTPAYSPEEVVARIRAGDESAWRAMTEQYEPLLRWLARPCGLSAEDADDVIQLTWLRCLEHIDQLTDARTGTASWSRTSTPRCIAPSSPCTSCSSPFSPSKRGTSSPTLAEAQNDLSCRDSRAANHETALSGGYLTRFRE